MKGILKQLKKQRANLVKASEHRDDYFNKRKEQWQNSASGAIYDDKTGQLADIISNLDTTINEFQNFLNDC